MTAIVANVARAAAAEHCPLSSRIDVVVHSGDSIKRWLAATPLPFSSPDHPSFNLGWLSVLEQGLAHRPILLEARNDAGTVGVLPLALVESLLFGRFLVSLPYVNIAGLQTIDPSAGRALLDRAVALADERDVRYLELRGTSETAHPALTEKQDAKVLMRLSLPATTDALWNGYKSKLRSQIRSGEKHPFEIRFGGHDCLDDFYAVFSRNMRDLGTPVFSRRLFAATLDCLPGNAELCIVRLHNRPVAAALLTHGQTVTEVPSASALREFSATSANMVLYHHLLRRAVERGQQTFDFGRSTIDGNTYRFKKQWGAVPHPSVWQYYVRRGSIGQLRPENAKFGLAIRTWKHLPVWLTRLVGPSIVRGIP